MVDALEAASARVRRLAASYEPPDFAHVPDPDAAVFLCAVDHRTGYRGRHLVGGAGPYGGSALMWAVALHAADRDVGLLTAARLSEVEADDVAELFRIGGETVADQDRRARLWRDLATGLLREHDGRADRLLERAGGRLGGGQGLLARLAGFEAFSDPLGKKSYLFAKICERRGWLRVEDPENWQVSADNVLMRLALRSGLVEPGDRDEVRAATREAFADVAARTGISPPVLDDLLWELGRENPDLLGAAAGDLREPERPREGAAAAWY